MVGFYIFWNGREAVVLLLVEHGADLFAKDSKGGTPLHSAARGGREDVALLLIRLGADVTVEDTAGATPLHTAAFYGQEKVLRVLLENGAELRVTDQDGATPLNSAVRCSYFYETSLLLLLLLAARYGCIAAVCLWFGCWSLLDTLVRSPSNGRTPEDLATPWGRFGIFLENFPFPDRVRKVARSVKFALFRKLVRTWPAESHVEVAAMLTAEAVRRAKCEAFAMGQLERLGAKSRVLALDSGVVRIVLEHV